MLTMAESPETLRSRLKEDIDKFDMDELKKLYDMIATIAAEKAIKLADIAWEKEGISRERIEEEVRKYRQANR